MAGRLTFGAFVFMTAALAPNTLGALPVSPTTSITIGDKQFDGFSFELFGGGGLCCTPPFGASEISVTPLIDGDGNVGLRFEGPFSKAAAVDGGQPWGFLISFDVATLDSRLRIDGSRLAFDAVTTEGGFAEVISILRTSSGEFVEDLFVIAADTFTQLEDRSQLAVPLDRVRSGLGFGAAGVGTVDFTKVDQTFTQTRVPEPSVFALLGLGLFTVAAVRKCLSVKMRSDNVGGKALYAPGDR
jgi:PEP-CTERM motif